jgi:cyclophilin family peptidyl-prolyl cis-trans isomerase
MPLDALVVLGCRVGESGVLYAAAARRVERAASAYLAGVAPIVVASGGKRWQGLAEASAFKSRLIELGVPAARIVLELGSRNTRQNARYSAELARERGFETLGVVTCDWHMPRALAAFRHYGISTVAVPATAPGQMRVRRWREPLHRVLDQLLLGLERLSAGSHLLSVLALLLALVSGCRAAEKPSPATSGSGGVAVSSASSTPRPATLDDVLAAEQVRRPELIPASAFSHADPEMRTAAARALARSSDSTVERLLPLLADEAPSVVRAVAFGLGRSCAGREAEIARALALRAAVWLAEPTLASDANLALPALAQALGRCANDEAERSLRAWLTLSEPVAEAAALGLAQLAARRGKLDDASYVALLDALQRRERPVSSALAPFARLSPPAGALLDRMLELARAELSQSGERRSFAIRALGRAGAVAELEKAMASPALSPSELAEVARELSHLAKAGQRVLAAALPRFVPSDEAERRRLVEQAELPALLAVLEALASGLESARQPLLALARLELPNGDAARLRRAVLVRCAAARLVADSITNPELVACDPNPEGRQGKLALLFVLDQGKLTAGRAQRFRALARDPDPVVRQTALRRIPGHRELDGAAELLIDALGQSAPGVVATAAEILSAHPDRVDSSPAKADAAEALTRAYRAADSLDNIGVRTLLIDAVAALGLLGLMTELGKSCDSDNPSLREHAERALRALGQPTRRCSAPAKPSRPAVELTRRLTTKVKLVFRTDLGELYLELDPREAPIAVTRVVDLARQGFYDGSVVHRVVPGFIAQLGDPGGDGYGAAPLPALRSELAPTPFEAGAVGMAQSGPDSASSQLFVTLGRFPHLDGESARIGRAGPGWDRLLVGDRILEVRVEDKGAVGP